MAAAAASNNFSGNSGSAEVGLGLGRRHHGGVAARRREKKRRRVGGKPKDGTAEPAGTAAGGTISRDSRGSRRLRIRRIIRLRPGEPEHNAV